MGTRVGRRDLWLPGAWTICAYLVRQVVYYPRGSFDQRLSGWIAGDKPLLAVLLVGKWKDNRQKQRARHGLCLQCGYDLRATPGRCPECGMLSEGPAGVSN